jgi:hypothetical protein
MLNESDNRDLEELTRDEPGLVRFSEAVTATDDPEQAARYADLFLLCMVCVGTVFGSLAGCGIYLWLFANRQSPFSSSMASLLTSVALGGACGCATVMVILHTHDLIRWETRKY